MTGSPEKNSVLTGRKKWQFQKGKSGNPKGRPRGSQNKTTRAVKEFLAELCDDSEVHEAVKNRVLKGDAIAFFRALEQVIGRPVERTNVTLDGKVELTWKDWPK